MLQVPIDACIWESRLPDQTTKSEVVPECQKLHDTYKYRYVKSLRML